MSVIVRGKNPNKPYTVRFWVDGRQRERSFRTARKPTTSRSRPTMTCGLRSSWTTGKAKETRMRRQHGSAVRP
jgi:hypothetical protein